MRAIAITIAAALAGCAPVAFVGELPPSSDAFDLAAAIDCVAEHEGRSAPLMAAVVTFYDEVCDERDCYAGMFQPPNVVAVATAGAETLADTALVHELTKITHYAEHGESLPQGEHAFTYGTTISACNNGGK